ncbi:ubiquinone anaerobic biosynthesis accessory factor UbiT [Alkalimarinus coralli]|uniref:ubiquinone anaerobic biosynthesis accessory factor UbiT n=1 Tax=Alkalimarinus coralli TaxID=2935863 RepID=UPI00202B5C91|nr:SCP2 sterol-binding domain-containing protein [Alkalimarinus coralli]
MFPRPPSPSKLYSQLPRILAKPLAHVPFPAQRIAMTKVLQQVFKEALESGECEFLRNRWLLVKINDLGINWYFSLGQDGKILLQPAGAHDVSISGNLNEFILLAARKEDPDTLFFQRRLLIEGDTELGLEVKNLIDSLDTNELSNELRFLLSSAGEYVGIFAS